MLQSYEGVVAAKTGHVAVHEAGAIEYSGHKVIEIPSHQGKIHAAELKEYIDNFVSDLTDEEEILSYLKKTDLKSFLVRKQQAGELLIRI